MKVYRKLYDADKFDTIREYINSAIKKFPNNNAFILKNKDNGEVHYTNISYTRFGDEIKALGTALIDLGLENKRIAIIGKNRYEWVLSFVSIYSPEPASDSYIIVIILLFITGSSFVIFDIILFELSLLLKITTVTKINVNNIKLTNNIRFRIVPPSIFYNL